MVGSSGVGGADEVSDHGCAGGDVLGLLKLPGADQGVKLLEVLWCKPDHEGLRGHGVLGLVG